MTFEELSEEISRSPEFVIARFKIGEALAPQLKDPRTPTDVPDYVAKLILEAMTRTYINGADSVYRTVFEQTQMNQERRDLRDWGEE